MGKDQTTAVMADAVEIVRRLRARETTVTSLTREEYHCSHKTMIKAIRSVISEADWAALKRARLVAANLKTRFRKGHVPWTKGMRGLHLSPETEFHLGGIRGNAARRYRPVGAITLRRDHRRGPARRYIKVRDDGPSQYRYTPYARWVWEQAHGPVPAGRLVIHIDGDTLNDDLSNLSLADCRTNLARLESIRPGSVAKRCRNSAKARVGRRAATREIRRAAGRLVSWWECQACGADLERGKGSCPKCGSMAVERVHARLHPSMAAEAGQGRAGVHTGT